MDRIRKDPNFDNIQYFSAMGRGNCTFFSNEINRIEKRIIDEEYSDL